MHVFCFLQVSLYAVNSSRDTHEEKEQTPRNGEAHFQALS